MNVIGDVINHKIFLKNSENNRSDSPQNLQFGIVYLGETTELVVALENKSSSPLRWIISHAGELVPQVPGQDQIVDKHTVEMNNSMSVTPAEGVLGPFATEKVAFTFKPMSRVPERGFKCIETHKDVRKYSVPMQLKVLNSSNKHRSGEDPINFVLSGGACPLMVKSSKESLEFPPTVVGESTSTEFVLTNQSSILGIEYDFQKMAHYFCMPKVGRLMPLESTAIKVVFKPNQFGVNQDTKLKCFLKSSTQKNMTGSLAGGFLQINLLGRTKNISPKRQEREDRHSPAGSPFAVTKISSKEAGSMLLGGKLHFSEAQTNERNAWESKIANRQLYVDYIRSSHDTKVQKVHSKHFHDDGVEVDPIKTSVYHTYARVDPASGLIEPSIADEVHVFDNNIVSKKETGISQHPSSHFYADLHSHAEQKLYETLLEKMFEKVVHKLKPPYMAPKELIQTSITSSELTYIKTSLSSIDLGDITVHSVNQIPINFLNAIPSGKPIQISIVDEDHDSDVRVSSKYFTVSPSMITIPHNQVVGFGVSFQSHTPGTFKQNIAYIINSRYKYRISVQANVIPVELKLDVEKVNITVKCNESSANTTLSVSDPGLFSYFRGESYFSIRNEGNHEARFSWGGGLNLVQSSVRRGASNDSDRTETEQDGFFTIAPTSGCIPAKGSQKIKLSFIPGLKSSLEETLHLQVIDDWNKHDPLCVKTISLKCLGEVPFAKCLLITSVKQGPLDLGILPVLYSQTSLSSRLSNTSLETNSSSCKYNALACSPNLEFNPTGGVIKGQIKRGRTIKVRNLSMHATAFVARVASNSPEVEISTTEGFIAGNGGMLELTIFATPSKSGAFEEVILIYFAGSGRIFRIPIRFEGKVADIAADDGMDDDIKDGILVGSWGAKDITLFNRGIVNARAILDLRRLPQFRIRWKPKSGNLPPGSQTSTRINPRRASSARSPTLFVFDPSQTSTKKAPGIKFSKRPLPEEGKKIVGITVITPQDPIYSFDQDGSNSLKESRDFKMAAITEDREEQAGNAMTITTSSDETMPLSGNLYLIDLVPGEIAEIQLVFKPTEVISFSLELPIRIVGNPVNPQIRIVTEAIPSPLSMSITNINFKNKVYIYV